MASNPREPYCLGHEEPEEQTVAEYREEQRASNPTTR